MRTSLVCLMLGLLAGCAADKPEPSLDFGLRSDIIGEKELAKLQIGMTMVEVVAILEPARPLSLSVPALLYSAQDGSFYYLAFFDIDKNKLEPRGLSMVLHYRQGSGDAVYVLPMDRRGTPYRPPQG